MSGRPFTARYHSRCAACDEQIRPGDDAIYDESDNVIHADCEDAAERPAAAVCPRCWLTRPCGCDELGDDA